MPAEVCLGQGDADAEDLQAGDDAAGFHCNDIFPPPSAWIYHVEASWAKNDTHRRCKGRFGEEEAVPDDVGEESVEDQEAGKDQVGKVR